MELIDRINQYLNKTLCLEYTGKMTYKIDYDDDANLSYYTLLWPLNPDDTFRPLTLAGQFANEDAFYNYIIKEIKAKRFYIFKNFRAYKLPNASE